MSPVNARTAPSVSQGPTTPARGAPLSSTLRRPQAILSEWV
jgi:hypothetical protein